jgi:WD40 repeat protein
LDSSVVLSPDGRRLASGGDDKAIRIWNADTSQPIGNPLTGHTAPVSSVAFSPDGTRLVSASGDRTLRMWPASANTTDLCHKLTDNMSHQ